jgi:transcriptional regulator with XRE-family HTH domain
MSHIKYLNQPSYSPIGKWLIEYIDQEKISLTKLAQRAGVSTGALRYLVTEPNRVPTLETCAKLAEATNSSVRDILKIAGLSHKDISHEPQKENLLFVYDRLPNQLKGALAEIANIFSDTALNQRKEA